MALFLTTTDPSGLLAEFKKRVKQTEQKGKITTWEENQQGNFTHKADQVRGEAWFCPTVEKGRLAWYLKSPKGKTMTRYVYAYYHGHMTETFVNHFPTLFSNATSTANVSGNDNASGKYAG
jgi:hypothetical protein